MWMPGNSGIKTGSTTRGKAFGSVVKVKCKTVITEMIVSQRYVKKSLGLIHPRK